MSDTPLDLSVLIVSFRTRERTLRCLRSVFDHTHAASFEVIVVDNDSQDGTAAAIAREFAEVRLIPLDRNLGYGQAMNVAASTARGSHLILLNPDTVVLEGALNQFLSFARNHPGHGLYAGRTVNADGRTDPRSCWGAPSLWSLTCFGLGLSTIFSSSPLFNPESLGRWGRDSVREVGVVSGCLCLVPRSVWCQLGGFNPVYFMYGEDADLAMRAAKHGYRPIFTPDATIVHEVGASSATDLDKTLLLMRGKATLVRQQWSGRALNWALAMLWLGVWLRAVLTATRRKRHDTIWPQVRSRTSDWIAGYEGKQS